jgi:HAD superfamily hydrolase (TIGR01509 family)
MLRNIKAVLFDLDGTLIDSMWMWRNIDIEYLGKFGIEYPEDLQNSIEGMSFSETAAYFKERFSIPDPLEQMKEDWNRMAWEKYSNEVPLKEGVYDLLQYLRNNGIKTGIATSNSRELVDLVIGRLGVADYFDSIRTSCEVEKGKPWPDIYLLVAKDLGVDSEHCLVFEDVVAGVRSGRNAGMKVCAVYDEFSETDRVILKEEADYYIETFEELKKNFC